MWCFACGYVVCKFILLSLCIRFEFAGRIFIRRVWILLRNAARRSRNLDRILFATVSVLELKVVFRGADPLFLDVCFVDQ